MTEVTLTGQKIILENNLIEIGEKAKDFALTNINLKTISLKELPKTLKIFSIVPSLETQTCALSAEKMEKYTENQKIPFYIISRDLPFSQARFASEKNIKNIQFLSEMTSLNFGEAYGVRITTGPLIGLLSRCIYVLDKENTIIYRQLIQEISEEPNYQALLDFLKTQI